MKLEIRSGDLRDIEAYANISIAFDVSTRFEVDSAGSGSEVLREVPQAPPYRKDYDAMPGSHPSDWAGTFDTSEWGLVSAWHGTEMLGGIVIAFGSTGVDMLEGRQDLAVLWDVRVAPEARGQGIGSRLFRASESWATSRGCREIKVETQNINVGACRFYQRHGCELRVVDRDAYPPELNEIQLIWYKRVGLRG